VIDAQGYQQMSDDDVAARSEALLQGPERGGRES
jgi:hypothetical protein